MPIKLLNHIKSKITISIVLLFFCFHSLCQNDTAKIIKIHFLYGSKPACGYKKEQERYFGGLHGGHASIEVDGVNYGLVPNDRLHIFSHKKHKHSYFHKSKTYGKTPYSQYAKWVIFEIPINSKQDSILKKILSDYTSEVPYDYAFFGMRCASALDDIMSKLGFFEQKSNFSYVTRSFYPKKIRKRLFQLAEKYNYKITKNEGYVGRKWEKD